MVFSGFRVLVGFRSFVKVYGFKGKVFLVLRVFRWLIKFLNCF